MKKMKLNRTMLLFLLALFFLGAGSIGTVALANYATIVVEASVVNVRMGPGLSYEIMTQVEGGSAVTVLAEKNEWYKIRLSDGRIGWIASWLINNTEVTASQNLLAIINQPSVNIRLENNEDSEVIGTASEGDTFELLYEEAGWSQILYNGSVAWVLSELVTIEPGTLATPEPVATEGDTETSATEQVVTVLGESVNIRSAASLEASVLATALLSETFPFIGQEGEFLAVQLPDGQTGYVANWLASLDQPEATPEVAPVTTTFSEATIVIDAGHGGTDPGAVGSYLYEKEATMDTAQLIADRLQSAGANVILTRSDDAYVSLEERVYLSNSYQADLFISIHYDSTPEGVFRTGTTTYYYADQDIPLAELVNQSLASNLPLPNNGVAFGNYLVLRENTQPALLLELGYMNNNDDVATFDSNYYQSQVAESIYQALTNYFQY